MNLDKAIALLFFTALAGALLGLIGTMLRMDWLVTIGLVGMIFLGAVMLLTIIYVVATS